MNMTWNMYEGGISVKINYFRGEYAFLSNFWEVPVTYKGLTYGSNEAAFQAQKCIREEDKVPFT